MDGKASNVEFEFAVADKTVYAAGEEKATIPATVKNGTDGKINITGISFPKKGTYKLEVSEKLPALDSTYTGDSTVYKLEVKVESNSAGTALEVKNVNGAPVTGGTYALVNADGKNATFENTTKTKKGSLKISKTVTAPEEMTAPAEYSFTVKGPDEKYYKADGSASSEEVTVSVKAGESLTISNLPLGTYTVTEKDETVDGYKLKTVYKVGENATSEVTFDGSNTEKTVEVTNTYTKNTEARINGLKILTGRTLKAEEFGFKLTAGEGVPMPEKTEVRNDVNGEFTFGSIVYEEAGTYTYKISEINNTEDQTTVYDTVVYEVQIQVIEKDHKLQAEVIYPEEKTKVEITNKNRTVHVSKVDITNDEELSGAHIQVIDENGKVVDEWVSESGKTHEVKGLDLEKEYILRETVAPEGYTVTADTHFTLDKDGKVTSSDTRINNGVLLVEDAKTSVKVSKVDIADGKELEGATIQILDKTGNVVEKWVSGKTAHEITGLKTGEEYTLRETVTTEGYTGPTDTNVTSDEMGN